MINVAIEKGFGSDEFRDYALKNPNTLVYAEPRFLKLVAAHLEASCAWIVAYRNGEIAGLLPFLTKDGPLGPVFNSLAYYGSNGGVIQNSYDFSIKSALCKAFYLNAKESNAVSATIISNPLEADFEFYNNQTEYDFRDERIGMITHLPPSENLLMSQFDNPRPRNIRRARKEGVVVTKTKSESLDFLFNTHFANITAIGGLPKKLSFFTSVPYNMNSNDWDVFLATIDGKPVAALLVFYFNRTVEYFTPVIIEEYRNTQALALVIYESMCDAIRRGYLNWNWGGTWLDQGGVYDFKKRWGTSEYKYFYYTRIMNSDLLTRMPSYLLNNYAGFYLLPFNQLIQN